MTTKEQFAHALQASSKAGFPIVLNVMGCCKGCITEKDVQKAYDIQAEQFNLPAVTFEKNAPNAVWHFGGQNNRVTFSQSGDAQAVKNEECACYEDEYELIECSVCKHGPLKVDLENLMLNHPSNEAAQTAITALSNAGLSADWDGSRMKCIAVH